VRALVIVVTALLVDGARLGGVQGKSEHAVSLSQRSKFRGHL